MMTDLDACAAFFGWCALINGGLLAVSAILVLAAPGALSRIHARLFAVTRERIRLEYFRYLAFYKILFLVFNLVPFIVLRACM